MSLAAGDRLGPYEVIAPLGAGGMGEVYRARDTRLGRQVAIKILASGVTVEADRLARFEHEARAAAALNHPNITVLYDIGTYAPTGRADASEARPYLVIELLEGTTLRDRLSAGGLPVRKAIDYARQVALGLAAAHEKAIVHRDLKPENIFITADDRAKILDFGLAKLTESEPATAGVTSLPTTPNATVPGMVLGTAGYMAPEQVRGVAADYRSDLFAFGAVLYEMLSGQRAFGGDTPLDVMMAVAREEGPSLATARPDLPATLTRIVDRCLEKEPASRFQSTRDLAFALEGQMRAPPVGTPGAGFSRAERSVARRGWSWLVGGLVLGALVAGLVAFRMRPADERPQPLTFTLPAPFSTFRLPGVSAARPWFWSPSPDSRWLLGMDLLPDGRTQFVMNELSTGASRGLDSTAGNVSVVHSGWSPDSTAVAYFDATDGYLKRVTIDTGAVTRITQLRDVRSVEWGADGIVVNNLEGNGGPGSLLQLVPVNGGDVRRLGHSLRSPVVLPDGLVLAERFGDQAGLQLLNPKTGDAHTLAPDLAPMGYAAGYVLYNLRDRLVAHRLDVGARSLVGAPIPVGDAASSRVFASSLVLSWVTEGAVEITSPPVWVDRAGRRTPVPGEMRGQSGTTLAMHGDVQVAMGILGPGTNGADVWMLRLDTGAATRVSAERAWEDHPRWSPDGRRVLFRSVDALKLVDVGSAGPARTVIESIPQFARLEDWSRDERHALVSVATSERRYDIVDVDLSSGVVVPFATTPATESFARFSPEGALVAYVSDATGPPEVYLQRFPGTGSSTRVSQSGGTLPKWSHDGSRVYFFSPDGWIMEASISQQGGAITVGTPTRVVPGSGQDFLPSSDGRRFLLLESARSRGLALVNWESLLPVR